MGVTMRDQHIIRALCDSTWAIVPEKLEAIIGVIANHAALLPVAFDERLKPAPTEAALRKVKNGQMIAVLPIRGTLMQRAGGIEAMSGVQGVEDIRKRFNSLVGDDRIGAIVLDIDSPGGSTYGIESFANDVSEATKIKRVVAVANSLAASAAYWIGSQADTFYAAPGADVGSIGVFAMHRDQSALDDATGMHYTFVSAGKYKVEGNPHESLSDEARTALQERVDTNYSAFVDAVALGRNTTTKAVSAGFGQGRVVGAKKAKTEGMIDKVGTLDQALADLGGGSASIVSSREAVTDDVELSAHEMDKRKRRARLRRLYV